MDAFVKPAVIVADAPGADVKRTPKPDWQAPVITRIDIKRTMSGTGSGSDLVKGNFTH